jgi:CheY-like chemotaxis protein
MSEPASHSFAELLLDESAHALIGLTLEGRVCDWNRGAHTMFGYARAVVIADLLMPDVDGFEFVTRFRAMRVSVGVPIVVWTGKDLNADDRRRLQPSITGLVSKNAGGSRALVEELQRLLSLDASAPRGADAA